MHAVRRYLYTVAVLDFLHKLSDITDDIIKYNRAIYIPQEHLVRVSFLKLESIFICFCMKNRTHF